MTMTASQIEALERAEARANALARADGAASAPERREIATTPDGGRVLADDQGNLSFVSPSYSTTDPARIDAIMEGATPAEVYRGAMQEEIAQQRPIANRAATAFTGVPFVGSYGDEAAAAMFGPQAGQAWRAGVNAMQETRPGQSMALQAAGTVAGAVPMAVAAAPAVAAAAPTTTGARVLTGALGGLVAGGTEGGIYGAGMQEGEGRFANAAENAVIGGVLGGGIGAAIPLADNMVRNLLQRLRGRPAMAIQRELGTSPEAAAVIHNALERGNIDDAVRALDSAGPGAMLADAGQPTRELLDAAATAGGQAGAIARDAVDSRVTQQYAGLTRALDETLGVPQGRDTARAAIRAGTSGARDTAYNAAYAAPIDYAGEAGQGLQGLLRRVPAAAWRQASRLMALDGDQSLQRLVQIADDGTVTISELPDVRQIDYLTRALGDVADTENARGGALGGQTQLGRATGNLQRSIRESLRGLVPEYGAALDTAADAIRQSQAVEAGYTLLRPRTTREAAASTLRGATEAELTAARQGLRSYIDDQLANVRRIASDPNQDAREALAAMREMTSRRSEANVRLVMGRREADQLFSALDDTIISLELRAAIAQNSKTAIRGAIQGSVNEQTMPGIVETLAAGEPLQAGRRFVAALAGSSEEAQALRQMGIFEEIARVLTDTRGPNAHRALRIVQGAMNGNLVSDGQAEIVGRVLARTAAIAGHQEGTRYLQAR